MKRTQKKNKNNYNGTKNLSCLDQLKYFKSIYGLPPDPMHDVLEGVARVTFSSLINYLKENQHYKIDT